MTSIIKLKTHFLFPNRTAGNVDGDKTKLRCKDIFPFFIFLILRWTQIVVGISITDDFKSTFFFISEQIWACAAHKSLDWCWTIPLAALLRLRALCLSFITSCSSTQQEHWWKLTFPATIHSFPLPLTLLNFPCHNYSPISALSIPWVNNKRG